MKRTILLFCISLVSLTLFAQDIPNPGFENWTDQGLYEEPRGYNTSNPQAFFFGMGTNISRVSGRTQPSTAMRMEVTQASFGLPPAAFNLNITNPLAGGVPFTGRPDSLVGYFNYDLSPNDTFSIFAIFKSQGIPLGFVEMDITGSSNGSFERMAVPTGPFIFPPDSIGIVMGIGVLGGTPVIGDFVEIDELTFINSTEQLPNNSFEEWDIIDYQDPTGWVSSNLLAALSGSPVASVTRTTDAYSGNFAVLIQSEPYEVFGFRDTSGFLITADFMNQTEGFPYNGKPGSLNFYYKFEPTGAPDEKAFVNVIFSKDGIELSNRVMELEPTSQYSPARINFDPVTWPDAPDTCFIAFATGVIDTIDGASVIGSELFVDDLAFGPGVFVDNRHVEELTDLAYPNPVDNMLNLKESILNLGVETIEVVSVDGQMVRSFANAGNSIAVGELVPGWYVLRIITPDKIYLMKFEKL